VAVTVLTIELLQGTTLSLGDQKSGKDSEKHNHTQTANQPADSLGSRVSDGNESVASNNSAKFSSTGADTMRSRTISGGEDFSRDDESGGVGAKVEEELANGVERNEQPDCGVQNLVIENGENGENDCKNDKTHQLHAFPADSFNKDDGEPVPRHSSHNVDNGISGGKGVKFVVGMSLAGAPANLRQNKGLVQVEPVKGNIKKEPGSSCSEENLEIFPATKVSPKIGERGFLRTGLQNRR